MMGLIFFAPKCNLFRGFASKRTRSNRGSAWRNSQLNPRCNCYCSPALYKDKIISNLKGQGFMSVTKQQEKYKMIISADDINSTDSHFTINNLYLGNNYKPLKPLYYVSC